MLGSILKMLAILTSVRIEKKVLTRPKGASDWGFSEKSDIVHQIYVTNFSDKKHRSGSFGFWVHGDTYNEAAKKAVKKLLKDLKWSYKTRTMKWLKLS